LRKAKDKTKEAALALNGCTEVKFKSEPIENLMNWTTWFEDEAYELEQRLLAPQADHTLIVKEMEEGVYSDNILEVQNLEIPN
jgi:hypothetical protein